MSTDLEPRFYGLRSAQAISFLYLLTATIMIEHKAIPRCSHHWYLSKDADRRALAIYERHYSCRRYRDGRVRRYFCGPGEKIVLLTKRADGLLVWRRQRFSMNGQEGVNCAVFRNEGTVLSSRLIREAMQIAWRRWPHERLYTYINPRRIRSINPGCCFKQAGWKICGVTRAKRLVILEAYN